MSKFEIFYQEIQDCRIDYDTTVVRAGLPVRRGGVDLADVERAEDAFRQNIKDSAGRIMAAVVTEELSTSEAQTLLLYIQVIRG